MDFCLMPKKAEFAELTQWDFNYLNTVNISFIDKVVTMSHMLHLTDIEICERKKIVEVIINFLKPFYPDCYVMIFGSSMNGFGFKGCDLDLLFLPFQGYCNLDYVAKGNETILYPSKVLEGLSQDQLACMEEEDHLTFVQRVLRQKRKFISRVIFIPAKCPILNIEFVKHHFTCDFSASNRLVTNNTELLWLFGTLDARVKPLVIVLRYWAKSLGFIAKSRLSSYAFTLLVIFYLQNTDPPVLPSVKSLSEKSEYSRVIDGWETAICLDQRKCISRLKRNCTHIDQLLIEFFDFYWNFDFIQNVVSTYHGKAIPVKELKESTDKRIAAFPVTSFSIQDVFALDCNVSRNSDMKTSFKLALLIAKKLMFKENALFQSLFEFSLYQEQMSGMFEATKNSLFHFTCFPLYLSYPLCCELGITTNQFYPWYRKVQEIVLDVLQYGLLIECEVVDKAIWSDKRPAKKKRNIHADNVGNLQLIMSIQCTFHYNTIDGRKKVTEADLDDDKYDIELPSLLRKEFKISKYLIKSETNKSSIVRFMCHCYKYSAVQIPDVTITFSPLLNEPVFKESKIHFLSSFVQRHVKKILEEDLLFKQVKTAKKKKRKNVKRPMEKDLVSETKIANKKIKAVQI